MSADRLRVVLDSNIVVSAVIAGAGHPAPVLDAWRQGSFELVMSVELLAEVRSVLRRPRIQAKYGISDARIAQLLVDLSVASAPAQPPPALPLEPRDVQDAHVLACALGGEADYLVTGDQDLLTLHGNPALGSLRIVTPGEFSGLMIIRP